MPKGIGESVFLKRQEVRKVRRIAVVAILVMAFAFCGMAYAFENEPEGFRSLK